MSDTKFGSWSVAESPISIEYSLVVIEEIRHEVAEGFQRLSRGGIEVGGILYGTRDGRTVRVLAMRPIACEHARGPAFLLSDKDRVALNEQLVRDKDEPNLEGLISVGWFLSHTRSEIVLTDSDLEIYSIFFPAPWQVTLVIRPGRGGSMRAGFFVREADGTVKAEPSYLEFNFPDRLAGVLDRAPERPPRERPGRKIPSFYRADAETGAGPATASGTTGAAAPQRREPAPFALTGPTYGGPQLLLPSPPRRKWPWLVAWVALMLILAGVGWRWWMQSVAPEPITLAVVEHDGQLQVQWSHSAKLVREAVRGSLEISDGGESKTMALSREMLASGNFTYVRKTGDVEVRMTVETPDGARWQEASRYLGRPPAAAVASDPSTGTTPAGTDTQPPAASDEVTRLRQENARQAAQIQRLERTLRILQSRGIDEGKEQ
jgi:proteasome lid subunit RPN8/RPN11